MNSGLILIIVVKPELNTLIIIRDVDLDPLDTDDHSLEFLIKRVDSSR